MHALGSLDDLWHALIPDWDIPLDIPSNTSLTSLSSNSLRLAAVKSLKLDHRWRNPRIETRRAQCIISRNSSFVDSMRFLPDGRWLVTLEHDEQTSKAHVTLWSIADSNEQNSVFVVGRVRFLRAHHHHELEQITIGIAFARGTEEQAPFIHHRISNSIKSSKPFVSTTSFYRATLQPAIPWYSKPGRVNSTPWVDEDKRRHHDCSVRSSVFIIGTTTGPDHLRKSYFKSHCCP
ncbi:hypothetical protein JVT61DRAFT_6612 [Boletus reticuloceps]|uniref:Uncharacterized protein n=1 Tax=Boletus reticuloceps TaxID=495285 RepID=A0A8I2YJF8_9AGAM|nr:hypothetical protein JVT61DRAFT_6612 [Boletus reticuloceps]